MIEFGGVNQESSIPLAADIGNNARHGGKHAVQRRPASLFECGKNLCRFRCSSPVGADQFHGSPPGYNTTLLRGYSTMPVALAAFSRGMTSRAVRSSTMVFTATHSASRS